LVLHIHNDPALVINTVASKEMTGAFEICGFLAVISKSGVEFFMIIVLGMLYGFERAFGCSS
jgi:hypothetical protein